MLAADVRVDAQVDQGQILDRVGLGLDASDEAEALALIKVQTELVKLQAQLGQRECVTRDTGAIELKSWVCESVLYSHVKQDIRLTLEVFDSCIDLDEIRGSEDTSIVFLLDLETVPCQRALKLGREACRQRRDLSADADLCH